MKLMESLVVGDIAELRPNQVGPSSLLYFCSVGVLILEPAMGMVGAQQWIRHRLAQAQGLQSWEMGVPESCLDI